MIVMFLRAKNLSECEPRNGPAFVDPKMMSNSKPQPPKAVNLLLLSKTPFWRF